MMCLDSHFSGFILLVFAQLLASGGSHLLQNLQPLLFWALVQPPPLSYLSFVTKAIHGVSLSSNILEQECSHVWQDIKTQILAENQGNMVFPLLILQYFLSLITELYYILSLLAKDCQSPNTDPWQSVFTQQTPVSISCWPGSNWLLVEQEWPLFINAEHHLARSSEKPFIRPF